MIDEDLFIRGHINVRIDDRPIDDYDNVISDHYFEDVLGLTGEVLESNGSVYELHSLDEDDNFDISFIVEPVEFETDSGHIVAFEELVVRCTGTIIPINGSDVLDIKSYIIASVRGGC